MSDALAVDVFVEDSAHEKLLVPLLHRIAAEEGIRAAHRVRSARGGHPRAIHELELYQELARKGAAGVTVPDLLIVGIDANCSSFARARQSIRAATRQPISDRLVVASPDPHVERWYMADPESFGTVVGRVPRPGQK
jgi:hypothetical protein